MSRFFDSFRRWFRSRRRLTTIPIGDSRPTIDFGGMQLPISEATSHFLLLGTTGSGKTVILRLLMQSVLPEIGSGVDARAVVYDAKQDMVPLVSAIAPKALCRILHPFDERGVAWDMCADVREPRVAVELVFTLFPREHESQPFFSNAVRLLAYKTIISFMLSGDEWTFADLLIALSSTRRLKHILKRHPETRDVIHQLFRDPKLLANIESTIATMLLTYSPVAAAWESAKGKFSLRQWTNEESILILGNSDVSRAAIDSLNRCIVKRLSDLTLAQSESFTRRNWFFLDEASEAGRLDGLVSLVKKGRSKGAVVVLAAQGITGFQDEKLYGVHITSDLLAQFGNRFFGRLECPDTSEYASRLVGDQEIEQITISRTYAQHNSTTHNQQIVTRRAVLPVEFMNVDPCTRENGLSGTFLIRSLGCFQANLPGPELFDERLIPPDPKVPAFIDRPVESQYLRNWTADRAAQFGVTPPRPKTKKKREPEQQPDVNPFDGLDDLDS